MKQLTIRGFGKEVERELRRVARAKGLSLNRAAIWLLRRGAGLGGPDEEPNTVGDSLDALAGTWTEQDECEFKEAIEHLEVIDTELWS